MQYIVLDGKSKKTTLKILKKYICLKHSHTSEDNDTYCLLQYDKLPNLDDKSGVLILLDDCKFDNDSNITSFITIVNSSNKVALNYLSKQQLEAISCSTSSKDTVSISSLDENKATLTLLRNVKSISGKVIEPNDYIVPINAKKNLYEQMAAYTCLILLDIKF